jgi:hypothetical protein
MASSNQPFLNIEDSNLNVNILVFARYNSNLSVGMLPKEEGTLHTPENAAFVNVAENDVLSVDAYISKLHLTNLEKHHATWKLYNCKSPTWFFLR